MKNQIYGTNKVTPVKKSPEQLLNEGSSKRKEKIKQMKQDPGLIAEIINILINFWYLFIVNLQLCLLNYFAGMIAVLIQILGFYTTMKKDHS